MSVPNHLPNISPSYRFIATIFSLVTTCIVPKTKSHLYRSNTPQRYLGDQQSAILKNHEIRNCIHRPPLLRMLDHELHTLHRGADLSKCTSPHHVTTSLQSPMLTTSSSCCKLSSRRLSNSSILLKICITTIFTGSLMHSGSQTPTARHHCHL